ncbi:carboxymuconolactone decarboxylase family protein [Rhodalgimonas zhirmunskyi]|uniref:Carboxymuconolactone decarboxylase family protein n=1 Tax=Rhodalgimonas zhirmunskyi TaxID=2964767 RepID=A0AAJ1X5G1_9RHOB|nr:carboxymuconolactone decarboxylase family protein [Rhodoalgimonas zhirmunskyi]MDQ2095213.1 carboxymuconolactone decarboxylase family protein [Rhodoalgimonas zhirmunskyi]
MAVLPLLTDDQLSDKARAVFDDIRATRQTDYVNNFWRALAHNPDELEAVWGRLKRIMGPGALDPLVKEMLYIAVSAANACEYCCHSHTASARAKGMSDEMYSELLSVIGMASHTNALATALQVPPDDAFKA